VKRTVAIRLKIPDNEAYTAWTALRRLGVEVARVERSQIRQFDDSGNAEDLLARIARDETLFNPNKHQLELRDENTPRAGELWIDDGREGSYVGWQLYGEGHAAASDATVRAAAERLLCNPAIERAIMR